MLPKFQDFFDTFRAYYGPLNRAWESLDGEGRDSLEKQIVALAGEGDTGGGEALRLPADYLEVVVTVGG